MLTQTLRGLNAGKTADQLAAEVCLPDHLATLPCLGEFYGSIDWSVRAICAGCLGWFDGNPSRLHPLAPVGRAQKLLPLLQGADTVLDAIDQALVNGEAQWVTELADLLIDAGERVAEARERKIRAIRQLATLETSANGRHYYLEYARELEQI